MNQIWQYLSQHPTTVALTGSWLASAAISSMPDPQGSGKFYNWLYGFLHFLAANLNNLKKSAPEPPK